MVIGYPLGHYDIINNIPIIRDATVSSVSDISTKNKPFFVIDSKLQEGMSGSPITTKPPNSARSRSGRQIRFMGHKKNIKYLVGIHSGELIRQTKDESPLYLYRAFCASLIPEIIKEGVKSAR